MATPPRGRAAGAPPICVGAAARELGVGTAGAPAPPWRSPPRGRHGGGLRHRHRHRGRQDRRRRGDRADACRRRPAGRRLQAGAHRPRRPRRARPRAAAPRRRLASRPTTEIAPYRYGPPASPHLAAELAGEEIDPALLLEAARAGRRRRRRARLRGGRRPAGAARRRATWSATSPSTSGCRWSIAASPGLGTINHTLLTIESARAAGLEVAVVVLTPWPARAEPRSRAPTGRRSPRSARSRSGPCPSSTSTTPPAGLPSAE